MAELGIDEDTNLASPPALAQTLSHWAMDLRFDQAPIEVQRALRSCLLYNLGMALAVDEAADPLGQALSSIASAEGPARLFGARGQRSAADAAFINAGLITARGQNDTHPEVMTHIGCIVIPAVLALAEMVQAPAQRVLDALLVGYESIPRLEWRLQIAKTSRDGVHAALLAREGLSGAPFCLEGSSGFGAAYAATVPTLDFAGWKTPQMVFKP